MNAIEKLDKILRRLSSKTRRATTRRVNCYLEVSTSGSDEDDLVEQQTDISKNDRKGGSNRRIHLKPIVSTVQNIGTTTVTKQSTVSKKHFVNSDGISGFNTQLLSCLFSRNGMTSFTGTTGKSI